MPIREEQKQQTHQALLNAVLSLSCQGRTFSSMSLREITGEVNLAPATFYRHFQNMDHLALELIDHIGIFLKACFGNICKMAVKEPYDHEQRLNYLFDVVSKHPEYWSFFIHERSSGSTIIRQAIKREVKFLVQYTASTIQNMQNFAAVKDTEELPIFADIFVNMTFCWVIQWLDLRYVEDVIQQKIAQDKVKVKALLQTQLIYGGIQTWK